MPYKIDLLKILSINNALAASMYYRKLLSRSKKKGVTQYSDIYEEEAIFYEQQATSIFNIAYLNDRQQAIKVRLIYNYFVIRVLQKL